MRLLFYIDQSERDFTTGVFQIRKEFRYQSLRTRTNNMAGYRSVEGETNPRTEIDPQNLSSTGD